MIHIVIRAPFLFHLYNLVLNFTWEVNYFIQFAKLNIVNLSILF